MKFLIAPVFALLSSIAAAQTVSAVPSPLPSALSRVAESGTLRVCTPGDYKPFSFLRADGSFEGLDVDLMGSLATAIGAKPQFVKTTWANLMKDFVAGKCDIAAGGISVTLERQKLAYFSAPYMVNGKTPIARCENAAKYQSIDAINRPEVRVIANPGGSNERFAKTRLQRAQLTIHRDNLTIFDEVIAGRADVFVTEAAEAVAQSRIHPELCAVNPEQPLQYAEMAFLLPNADSVFKGFVDQWLHLAKASGEYQVHAAKWLGR